jgi:spermidine synthase
VTAALLAFVPGFLAVVGQTLLARELLVLFHGSELALGLVLAAWLLCTGLGARAAGLAAPAHRAGAPGPLAATALAAAVGLPAAIVAARTAGVWLGIPPGTLPGLRLAALAVTAVVAVVAAPCGAWYVLAAGAAGGTPGPGRTYAWEAAGGLAGGAAFTWLLAGRADGLAIGTATGAIALAATAGIIVLRSRPGDRGRPAAAALLGAAALLALVDPVTHLSRRSQEARWPRVELEGTVDSPYGNLALVRTGAQHTLFSSGSPAFSFPDPEAAAIQAHLPLLAAPAVERVLIAGGGIGGVLAEVLKHPVREVDCTELDRGVLALVGPRLPAELASALADPRAAVRHEDPRAWLAAHPARYDVVLLEAPEPASAAANRFATREFFSLVRRALRDGGVAALALPASPNYLGPELRARNASIAGALAAAFPRTEVLAAEPLTLLASSATEPLVDPAALVRRLRERHIAAGAITPEVIEALLAPDRRAFMSGELRRGDVPPNSDRAPVALYLNERYREALEDARGGAWLPPEGRVRGWLPFALPAALLLAALLPGAAEGRRRRAAAAAALTTGWAAMGLQYLLLFVYQTSRGALYGEIGLLTGAFMGGLGAGALLTLRRIGRGGDPARLLPASDAGVLAMPLLALALFTWVVSSGAGAAGPPALVAFAALAGAVAGAQFPLLAAGHPGGGSAAALGSRYYALDLAGSAAGALLTALWLLPLAGLAGALAFLACLKGASWALLASARRP